MPLASLIHALGSMGLFPSRAFLPAFVTALVLRFGHAIPWVAESGLVGKVDAPTWFTSNASLIVLGMLSLLELAAARSSDLRQLLDQLDGHLKAGMALLTTLGVASVRDAQVVGAIQQAGMSDALFGLMAAGGVYFLTSVRRSFYELLNEMDFGDSLGLQRLFNWAEDAWVALGAVMLIVFPLAMIFLTAVAFGLLYLCQQAARRREEHHRIACSSCGQPIYGCATACPHCDAPNANPCTVGWLGQSKPERPADPHQHPLHLLAVRRCYHCATRLRKTRPQQSCEGCGRDVLCDQAQADAYLALVQSRLPRTLLVCFGLGLVPVVGVVPAIVYYRLQLVNPMRRYVPFGSALLAKWTGRFACLAVLSVQWVPIVGIASLPIMASINYFVYRRAFQKAWQRSVLHAAVGPAVTAAGNALEPYQAASAG